jgi:hypothetical protein
MKLPVKYCTSEKVASHLGLALLLFLFSDPLSFSQMASVENEGSAEKRFSEEIYTKTDRDLYIAGEKVWLKIYKLNGLTHSPVNLSKIVYVDLLNNDNNPVTQLKIGIEGYSGYGDFRLPDTLRTGNYFLRAYTNWMQNYPDDLFSYKSISVINPFEDISSIKIPSHDQVPDSISFYPEGGHLIDGITIRTGFKAINKKGDPVSIKGALVSGNDTLCNVRTDSKGYGWTLVNPSGQEEICLITSTPEGLIRKFRLPPAENEGITLSATEKSENTPLLVRISRSTGFNPGSRKLFLVLNSASQLSFRKEITPGDNETGILKKDIPPGLSDLMIVDDQNNVTSQRWIYNEAEQPVNFNIDVRGNRGTREKIRITVSVTDAKGNPVESDFSISVAKAVTVENKGSDNMYRQLPELAAHHAGSGSTDINDYLIFLKGGEVSFKKEKGNSDTGQVYLPELEGHLISGTVRDRKSEQPLANEKISLSYVGKIALCQFAKTDKNGDFNFLTREQGLHEIVIQPLNSNLADCYVDLNIPFTSAYTNYRHGTFFIDSSRIGEINNAIISMQINNIYEPFFPASVAKKTIPVRHNFYGNPENTIVMSNYIELTSIREVIRELVPGVSITKNNNKTGFRLLKQYQSNPYEKDPLVLVDGVPVYDFAKVLEMNSRDIDKIDVLISRYYISDNILDGILHFVSKKGDLGAYETDKAVFRQEYDFPREKNEFYSPDYSVDSLRNGHLPDFRNTLYWKPDLHTGISGKATVEFYSSDEPAEYTITVQGITGDGRAGTSSMPLIIKSR